MGRNWVPAAHPRRTLARHTTVTEGRSHEAPGHSRLSLARYRCRHYRPRQARSHARNPQPVSKKNHYVDDHPPGPFESISQTFSVAGKSSWSSRTDFPGGCGRPLRGAHTFFSPTHTNGFLPDFPGCFVRSAQDGRWGPPNLPARLSGNSGAWGLSTPRFLLPHFPPLMATPRRPSSR
ncbi:hypothetical protein GWK47_047803 [Chionoecetes opilio]|uniref:Uncharacterized protein n=1 Tax=Chionoecetes opilio TaxID=41210 RepID=A0A8J4Y4D2_CHIOP|nr:hypothetical protein GWK47_047803 [Chionoecetes opilio]